MERRSGEEVEVEEGNERGQGGRKYKAEEEKKSKQRTGNRIWDDGIGRIAAKNERKGVGKKTQI